MAWSMPTSGQWNPGIGMTPDINMGSYTPEQWALIQQQNWQWTQWQQSYAHWQNQYGSEYAQQLQGIQAMPGMQPAPSGAVPPPVPPPEKPPPPPPHENDQPLYGNAAVKVVPVASSVKPHQATQVGHNSSNTITGNNQNWSHTANPNTEKQSNQGVNSEALRVLAEEEKSFEIQFQKWEEEIEKWKLENVNHPDRQAYREYEQKFEACRAQLLERRRLMNTKRDNLMGEVQSASATKTGINKTNAIPTPLNTTVTNYKPNMPTNVQSNVQNQKTNLQSYSEKPSKYEQYNNATHQGYNRNDNNVQIVNTQDKYNSYQNLDSEYRPSAPVHSTFIPTSKLSKDIPGLDLVPQVDKSDKQDIIDITEELQPQQQNSAAPDYSKISKGINNILGDIKIMNILSMMTNQKPNINEPNQSEPFRQPGNMMESNQWSANNSNCYNNDYDNQQQNVPYRPQNNMNNYQNSQEQGQNSKFPDTEHERYDDNANNRQGLYYNRQNQFGNQNMQQRPPLLFRPNMPAQRPNMPAQRPNMPAQRTNMPAQRPNMSVPRLNMPHPRPQLQHFSPQQNFNYFPHGGFERKEINQQEPMNQPVKPKWVDKPLLNPSVIVEYEHKPLRLKARDFLEPVHMIDYDHKSKNGDNDSKKDFAKDYDELFPMKPRNADCDNWSSERLYTRDYDRGLARDDYIDRSNVSNRANDIYDRRVDDRRLDDRRFDDRDRSRRQDYDRKDRGDNERLRDVGYSRDRTGERDMGRGKDFDRARDIDRDLDRDRDFGRERDVRRDLGRDRDIGRDRDPGRARDFGRDRDINRDRDSGRDRNSGRDPMRDRQDRRDPSWNRSRSRDIDNRKREHSKENDSNDSFGAKKTKETLSQSLNIVMIDDLLEPPGRDIRPEKIVIILRGLPGSGKSYLAKLIRDKEAEHGVTVRIMSIDDYFMHESEIEEKDPTTGKIVKKPSLKYEYDESLEESYMNSLKRAFKRSLTDGYFTFLIYDAINEQLKHYADIWNFGRQCGFQVYICTMEMDAQACFKRNIHNRLLDDIEVLKHRFFTTPSHHLQLDATTLLQNASIREVQMEDVEDVTMEDTDVVEVDSSFTSKWEKMDDAAQLARLDGTSRPLRSSQLSMEDYLQLDDWKPNISKPGKKSVRWADLEERREQEKMRAIGFVVGQTDWQRMTDPTMGSSALTQTKYIERVRRS